MEGTRAILIDAFGRIGEEVHAVVAGLDAAALAYRPDEDANSIAWLLWHLTRVEDDHVSELARIDQAYVAGGWAARLGMAPDTSDIGYGHTSEQVAAVRFPTPDVLLAYFDAVHARIGEYLARLDAEELARLVDYRWDPPVTAAVRLVSVISDSLQHVGQAAYVRGLFERRG
jgi:uncharacterized damage-inducible protein DinB